MQIQQRQHLGDLRGLPHPGRQDRRREPHPFTCGLNERGHRMVVRNGYPAEREVTTAAGAVWLLGLASDNDRGF